MKRGTSRTQTICHPTDPSALDQGPDSLFPFPSQRDLLMAEAEEAHLIPQQADITVNIRISDSMARALEVLAVPQGPRALR